MSVSRRSFAAWMPLLATARGASGHLPSGAFAFDSLTKKGKTRPVLSGATDAGCPLEMHITELAPGEAPHPPHHHAHNEMIMIYQGTLDVTINGKTTRVGPGGSAYIAANEEHGWTNAGTSTALYFVLAIGA